MGHECTPDITACLIYNNNLELKVKRCIQRKPANSIVDFLIKTFCSKNRISFIYTSCCYSNIIIGLIKANE